MEVTMYVPTSVGPSKLEQALADCPELSDESKEKVCMIQDIVKIGKLLGHKDITPKEFYAMYEMSSYILSAVQHNAQVELNTAKYHNQL